VHDGLDIGARSEDVAGRRQPPGQLAIVVDLPIHRDPHRAVFAGHRLATALEIDDAQPAHAERSGTAHDEAHVVRTAVHDAMGHALEEVLVGPAIRPYLHETDDPAHGRYSTLCMERCYRAPVLGSRPRGHP